MYFRLEIFFIAILGFLDCPNLHTNYLYNYLQKIFFKFKL
ncbi:hypothetical protein [Enterocloster phage PMBT24]|uniref:Uncharacterized protein n=1 Tax=Enterocloster phage PMBT24 TaxID=3025413 RepID=A0AAT9TRV2_9CAUD|nr:hypothetical protein [Enterocloster phage PMBT24]